MESMKQELEEKIRKLEEDKQNMDISAGKSPNLICLLEILLSLLLVYFAFSQNKTWNLLLTKLQLVQ